MLLIYRRKHEKMWIKGFTAFQSLNLRLGELLNDADLRWLLILDLRRNQIIMELSTPTLHKVRQIPLLPVPLDGAVLRNWDMWSKTRPEQEAAHPVDWQPPLPKHCKAMT